MTEGDALTFTVTASEAVAADTDVVFTVIPDDTAAADQGTNSTNLNDFVQSTFNPVTVTIPAGETTATFSVTAKDDGVTELPENYSVTAALASGGGSISKSVSVQDGQSVNTIALTTNADNITGTSGNDLIAGVVDSGTATSNTFGTADTINGGVGSDTLAITVTEVTGATTLPAADTSNVEKISVRNVDVTPDAVTLSAASFQGATEFIADRSTADVLFTNVSSGAAVTVKGNGTVTNSATTVTYNADATAPVLNVQDGTKGANAIVINAAGATSFTINSTGAVNAVGAITAPASATSLAINAATGLTTTGITAAGATSLTVSGAAATGATPTTAGQSTSAVQIGTVPGTVTTIDASGLTAGGLGVTLDTAVTSFIGGQGNDTVTTAATTAATDSMINAGAGDGDRLVVANGGQVDTSSEAKEYAGFEILDIGATTVDSSLFTNSTITGIMVGGLATITNMTAAQASNVTIYADSQATYGITGAALVGQLDSLTLKVDDGLAAVRVIVESGV